MPWYRTGTVAITAGQTTVTGNGTAFALNSRVGDAFQGPDGRWYEVTNIASATVLSILPAYQGATVSGGPYGLAPMQGYVKESADRLRQLVEQFGATFSLFGGATSIETLRQNIMAATRGANSDITSLSGLTKALSVSQGGTGGTTQATARSGIGALGAGDYGLGGNSGYPGANTSLDSLLINSLFSATDSNPSDWQSNGGRGQYPMGLSFFRSAIVRSQLAISYGTLAAGGGVYWRCGNGAAGAFNNWLRLLNEGEQSIGIGQSWSNVTASRALNTTYTNNTGRPIQLAAQAGPSSAVNTALIAVVGGVNVYTAYAGAAAVYIGIANVIVPPGSSYRINVTLGTATLTNWSELS